MVPKYIFQYVAVYSNYMYIKYICITKPIYDISSNKISTKPL